MRRRYSVVLLSVLLALSLSITAALEDRQEANQLTDRQDVQAPVSQAACTMTKTSGTAASFWSDYMVGYGTYTYFDPAVECGTPAYPFELTAFSVTLNDPGGYVWPVQFDVVVRSVTADGSPCNGPQGELCRFSVTADAASFGYPAVGTVSFPTPCCITEPVFIGIEYTSGAQGSTPSLIFDDNPAPVSCDNWMIDPTGAWTEWYTFWTQPGPGYPLFWVDGETQSPNCVTICDWNPGDPHKMHYPQLPNAAGWAVNATAPVVLADDWLCSETGWIKDLHWWGGWRSGLESQIVSFVLSIHSDIPADQNPEGYSKPGPILWQLEVPIDGIDITGVDPPTLEGWYNPETGEVIYDDHQPYYQYNYCLPEPLWFWQDVGVIYWVNISAVVTDATTQWGWKSTLDHWNDDAVWGHIGAEDWIDLYEPGTGSGNPYIPGDVDGDGDVDQADLNMLTAWLTGGGPPPSSWTPDGSFYPAADVNGDCVNDNLDVVHLSDFLATGGPPLLFCPQYPPGEPAISLDLAFVVTGEPPAEDGACCLPDGSCIQVPQADCEASGGTWMGPGIPCSAPEACCLADGTCIMADPLCCEFMGGVAQGAGTSCTAPEACCMPDGTCINADPLCCTRMGGVPQGPGTSCTAPEACCLQDGTCIMVDPECCDDLGGTPQGPGTTCTAPEACCLPDGTCIDVDPLCCLARGGTPQGTNTDCASTSCVDPTGACCLDDNSCIDGVTAADCALQAGTYMGDGTYCLGDNNGNGEDDLCEGPWQPGDIHKMHYPQLPDEAGWDVNASWPIVLADDWMCSETGWVKDIHFWGSWLDGNEDIGGIISFTLSIHSDIPAGTGGIDHSRPGQLLWENHIADFKATKLFPATLEGYYDPYGQIILPDNHQEYFQYDVQLPEPLWFWQDEGTIYWLNITAHVENPTSPGRWGWKSSIEHWNDDAVWGFDNSEPVVVVDNGAGTADLPVDAPYTTPPEKPMVIIEGLPPDATIEMRFSIDSFFDIFVEVGGSLGGERITMQANATIDVTGTGALAGFNRTLFNQVAIEMHTGPRLPRPGHPQQTVEIEIVSMSLSSFGDPDFCALEIRAGSVFDLPSPGNTTLTPSGDNWQVDSFFDITYRITFEGCPGSQLDGMSGTTQGTTKLFQGRSQVPFWTELYEPPDFQQSLDLSFVITGGEVCDCIPGDANNDGAVNVGDAVYMINFVFNGGPAPGPYLTCSGDANCDCQANVGDAVYIINFVFKGGPPPCDCQTWLSLCGPPIFK